MLHVTYNMDTVENIYIYIDHIYWGLNQALVHSLTQPSTKWKTILTSKWVTYVHIYFHNITQERHILIIEAHIM